MAKFSQYNLKLNIVNATKKLGFKEMTPIQEESIPSALKGSSIIGQSQTGSGKTHAFLVPIFNQLDVNKQEVQAVITAPTRELAMQIYEVSREFAKLAGMDVKITLVTGGSDKEKLVDNVTSSQPQIVVGTPGRIRDIFLNSNGALRLTTAKFVVIDEADMILDMGFIEDVSAYVSRMPEGTQFMVFSATIPVGLKPFLKKNISRAKTFQIEPDKTTSKNITHYLLKTKHKDRFELLSKVADTIDPYICIVFVNKKTDIEAAYKALQEKGFKVGQIHGDLQPRERKQMLKRANDMEYKYIVATDIAARGIDIDGVSHVISIGLPYDLSYYIHRSGRTGRGKYTGESYVMYDTSDEKLVNDLEKMGVSFESKKITAKGMEVERDRNARTNRSGKIVVDGEVASIIGKTKARLKREGVKPGYKARMKNEITKAKASKKREVIKASIKGQKKLRAMQKQKEMSSIDWK